MSNKIRTCPTCKTGEGYPLGNLGYIVYYKCQDCGSEFRVINKAKKTARLRRAERKAKEQHQKGSDII